MTIVSRANAISNRERLRSGISRHSLLDQAAHIELRVAELSASALFGAAELALRPDVDPACSTPRRRAQRP